MLKALLALATGLLFAAPALAGPMDWTGAYAGLDAGVASGRSNTHVRFGPDAYFTSDSEVLLDRVSQTHLAPTGATVGVLAGLNKQVGHVVLGLETDFSVLDLAKSNSQTLVYPCCAPSTFTLNQSIRLNGAASARARLGWAFGRWLVYGAGGPAFAEVRYGEHFSDTFGVFENAGRSAVRSGWSSGGGVELATGRRLAWRLDFLHADYGKLTSTAELQNVGGLNPTHLVHSATFATDTVRVGASWRF